MQASITTQHLVKARFILSTFDVILVLEHDPKLTDLAFNKGMGWHHTLHGELARSSNVFLGKELILSLVPTDMELLYKLNDLDAELYQHAAILSMLDQVVWGFAGDVLLANGDSIGVQDPGNTTLDEHQGYTQHQSGRTMVVDPKFKRTGRKQKLDITHTRAIESLVQNAVQPGFHRSCGFFVMNSSNKPHVMSWAQRTNSSAGNLTMSNLTSSGSLY